MYKRITFHSFFCKIIWQKYDVTIYNYEFILKELFYRGDIYSKSIQFYTTKLVTVLRSII